MSDCRSRIFYEFLLPLSIFSCNEVKSKTPKVLTVCDAFLVVSPPGHNARSPDLRLAKLCAALATARGLGHGDVKTPDKCE
ncbi:hypothetical protein EVAR_69592_1 [Eumeta japonica]|uniref:Uncharacterized protein n=1 Tax=Eumeta variegata TaxID=151549 RepID=A0A4C2ADF4_EUMVA|nr:hypothetical protein EVAR_69592_1 [Eumeta japonica]